MCPNTWNETAVNLPMQMNWLRFVPMAMAHDIPTNICTRERERERERVLGYRLV